MYPLTDTQVDQEVHAITTRDWPHPSILRMKTYKDVAPGNFPKLGVLFKTWEGGPETIVPKVMTEGGREYVYADLRAMVADGWIVD